MPNSRDATVRDGGVRPELISSTRTALRSVSISPSPRCVSVRCVSSAPSPRCVSVRAKIPVAAVRVGACQKRSPKSSCGTSKPSQKDSAWRADSDAPTISLGNPFQGHFVRILLRGGGPVREPFRCSGRTFRLTELGEKCQNVTKSVKHVTKLESR